MPKIRKSVFIYILVFFILEAFVLPRSSRAQTVNRLDNGLRVIVKEDHKNPIVVFSVFLRVGSAYEGRYLGSGISHLIEHMLFKGTKKYPRLAIEETLNKYGGRINGFTTFDYTGYRITILREHADIAIDILKEMLTSPVFDPGELKKEKEVIKREMDLSKDDPAKRLSRLTFSSAYIVHPYRVPVIGYRENFDRLGQKDLIDFFKENYTPEKMVFSVVGDIDAEEIYGKIRESFGTIPRGNNNIPVLPEEPRQAAEKRVEEAIDIDGAYLNIAFHSAAFTAHDLYELDLLSFILGQGESSVLNKKIRLEQGLALSISSYNYTPKYPGLFVISSVLKENKAAEALVAILKELEKVKQTGVQEEELIRAKNNFLAGYIYQKETVESQANDLAIGELLTGDPGFFEAYIERVKSVSADEIKAVADKYLDTRNMTVIALSKSGSVIEGKKEAEEATGDRSIKRIELENKLPVLISENPSLPMVSIALLLKGGLLLEKPDNNGISMLTSLMLMDGTDNMTREDIARLYESRGMAIGTYSANNSLGITITCLKEHTELAFDIASELFRRSVFPETELRREKDEMVSAIDMQDNRLFNHGHRLLKELLFKAHPYGLQATGTRGSVEGLEREDVVGFFDAVLRPDNMVLGVCGDCETGDIQALAEKYFSNIQAGKPGLPLPEQDPLEQGVKEKTAETQKEQSLVLYGFRGIDVYDKNRYAAEVMVDMLSMESGVLFKSIREREGLAYATGAFLVMGLEPGHIAVYALTSRENIAKVKGIISKEIKAFLRQGATEQELEKTKNHLKAMRRIDTQTNSSFIFNASIDELYGLGYNNYKGYDNNIDAVTLKDVKDIANRLLRLDKCAIVIMKGKD